MNYRIKETRKQLHLTQMEFAKLLGISYSSLSLAEKGTRSLPASAMIRLAELQNTGMDIDILWILTGKKIDREDNLYRIMSLYNTLDERGKQTVLDCMESQMKLQEI